MKFIIYLTLFCLLSITSISQNLIGKSFITNVENIRVYPSDTLNDGKQFYYVHKDTKFTVIAIDKNNNLVITFWKYNTDSTQLKKWPTPNFLTDSVKAFTAVLHQRRSGLSRVLHDLRIPLPRNNNLDYQDENKYIGAWAGNSSFIIPLASFNQQTSPYNGKSNSFNWGVMTLPVKLRLGNHQDRYFNFEEKINLGFTAGWKHQFQSRINQGVNVLSGFGIANVKTDSVSLDNGYYDSKHVSETAFSATLGCLYEYDVFQIGLFFGKDYLGSTLSRHWKYQGKTWIGLAIGISLFGTQTQSTSSGTNSNQAK